MDRHEPADDGPIVDRDVPGHLDRVRDDDVVANDAIVRDVHVRHEKAARPDRRLSGRRATPIDRAVFPNDRSAPDFHPGFLALVLEVLRVVTDDRAIADFDAVADARISLEDGVPSERTVLAHLSARPHT